MSGRFADPTLDDFGDWIDWHLSKATQKAKKAVGKIEIEASAKGGYRSSTTILRSFGAVREDLEAGIDTALGELKRAIKLTLLDETALRDATEARLIQFVAEMKQATKAEKLREFAGMSSLIDNNLAEFDAALAFALRQFDVGFLDPAEPAVPLTMTNSIHIGTMSGGALQQGTSESTQNVVSTINAGTIVDAVSQIEEAAKQVDLQPDARASLDADIATIKAQLSKPEPSRSILLEAARSMRAVAEGAIGGAAAAHLLAGIDFLLKSLSG